MANSIDNTIDPQAPAYVFPGLILVNFFPPIILPKI